MRPVEVGWQSDQSIVLLPEQRRTHLHVIGPSESGKSRFLEHLIRQDIQAGHGFCLLDPTGAMYQRLALWCAARGMHRRRPIHFFDPNSDDYICGFNPLQCRPDEDVAKRVDAVVLACARAWGENPDDTPLLARCLRAIFTALIERGLTLVEGLSLIAKPTTKDEQFVFSFLTSTDNPYIAKVWRTFSSTDAKRFEELFSSTDNRLGKFLTSERMRRIFGFGDGSIDWRQVMDEGHMMVVNLQPLRISLDNSRLLGTLITNELLQLARTRDNLVGERQPFYCYVDEAYKYLTDDIEQALDETRQKGLHYILAHQRLSQLRDAGPNIHGGVMSIRNKVVFGDLEPADTMELAEDLFQVEYDENEEVRVLSKPVTVGYELTKNRQYRTGESRGQGETESETRARSLQEATNTAISLPFDPLGLLTGDLNQGGGVASAKGRSRALQRGRSSNRSVAEMEGWAESYVPQLEERAGAVRSYDEQMKVYARGLKSLPRRSVYFKLRHHSALVMQVPFVGDPIAHPRRMPGFLSASAGGSRYTVSLSEADQRLRDRQHAVVSAAYAAKEEPDLTEPDDFFS